MQEVMIDLLTKDDNSNLNNYRFQNNSSIQDEIRLDYARAASLYALWR
jgi:hypothetical protein